MTMDEKRTVAGVIGRLDTLDKRISQRTLALRKTLWGGLAALGAHLGDSGVWAAAGAALWLWGTPLMRRATWLALLANVAALSVAGVIKRATQRARPFERRWFYLPPDRYSFPSGHSVRMGAIAVVVARLYPQWALPSFALALLVAACRVLVGVHYMTDVTVGLLLGLGGGAGILLFVS